MLNIHGFMLTGSTFICMYINLPFMCKANKKIIIHLLSWIWNINWNVKVNQWVLIFIAYLYEYIKYFNCNLTKTTVLDYSWKITKHVFVLIITIPLIPFKYIWVGVIPLNTVINILDIFFPKRMYIIFKWIIR